ncbi:hypothetical protein M899_0754 [Bacteriovorax sp. BSW11_IV]|uniref:hypothetical protein n=1 Tax=Bacteriovorax sp. BSW11_IV TaxID=1353529 RepID=UPI000389DB69|nr:hypothetical protein [Bacteriovorax sp. BSW11_IV]EQC49152.1 hypothetical protein M899_0754 [Bacteriovorax sp. BSW11_IV]
MGNVKKELKEHNDRLCEAASKFSHDVSGKLHVLQFCVDELIEQNANLESDPLFTKFAKVMGELCEMGAFYRDYLPVELDMESGNLLEEAASRAMRLAQTYHLKKREYINVQIVDTLGECPSCWQLSEILFSIYSYCLDSLESSKENPLEFQLGLKVLDSGLVTIKLILKNNIIGAADLTKYYEVPSYKVKNMRGHYGLQFIKKMSIDPVGSDTKISIVF